ncbi:phospho-sugar mutase [Virgibacillus proomii]|uniref:phospho-sugar mutase n=1 Tax=Virgibacillus proomii TaxID=84407 RepID=UPI000985CE1F|nr:phospho-sugar mutase [Virgibacillus proomii]
MNWKEKYLEWSVNEEVITEFKKELTSSDDQELEDRFYRYLEFGTGGMRGELGVGINRMNSYSIRRVSTGLAKYILSKGEEAKEAGVVIAYDNRYQSDSFAEWTARILASYGIKVFLSDEMRPTPELSFLVRSYQAFSGVMITASHNPANYNGFKVYGSDGGQITLETAETLMSILGQITNELEITAEPLEYYIAKGFVIVFGEEADEKYLKKLSFVTQDQQLMNTYGEKLNVVYTPLHGTGLDLVFKGLTAAGVKHLFVVKEQADGDSGFRTVKSPNPEDPAAFKRAIEQGERQNADLLMATDPDADRLGIAVKDSLTNSYQLLSGNQIGVLLLHYLLEVKKAQAEDLSHYFLAKTIVTSDLGSVIAKDYYVATRNTLTGFKFIGEQIALSERNKDKKFLFGYEESYGYLIKPFVRDKDAIQAALLISEVALYYKLKGVTLLEALENIYQQYGYYTESLVHIEFKGKVGQQLLGEAIDKLRNMNLDHIGGKGIAYKEDYLLGERLNLVDGSVESISLPKSNVIKFIMNDGSWICIRPSGTEPKCKLYFSVHGNSKQDSDDELNKLKVEMLSIFDRLRGDFREACKKV